MTSTTATPAARDGAAPGPVDDPPACPGSAVPGLEADLGWALSSIGRAFGQRAACAVSDLPGGPRGSFVLATAAQGPPRSQLALAQQLGIDKTVMTYLLDELEAGGLVERRPDPADRRARQVLVTDQGIAVLAEFRSRLVCVEQQLLGPLDAAEATAFRDMLQRVARAAQADPPQ